MSSIGAQAQQLNAREREALRGVDERILAAETLADVFLRLAEVYGTGSALTMAWTCAADGTVESLDHARLAGEVLRAANHFRRLGIGPNDRVLFLALPTPEAYFGFWGAQVAGCAVPVNPFLSVAALVDIARNAGARMVFASSAAISQLCADKAAEILRQCPGMQLVVCDDPDGGFARARAAMPADRLEGPAPGPDDICACFPTGGTTGNPKLARISHRGLLASALSSALIHSTDRGQVVPNGLPLFHVGGGVIVTFRTIMLGQHLVQLSPAGYRGEHVLPNFWELARRFGFTMMIAVPTVFTDAIDRYDGKGMPIRLFVSSASKLPETVFDKYRRTFGVGVHEGYGMTECAGLCASTPVWATPKPGSSGPAAPFYRVRVVEVGLDGGIVSDCPVGQAGIVAVRGLPVFSGYTDPALTAGKLLTDPADGSLWVDSGDIGRFDEDGFLWVTGRAKDVIIRGGHNIDPACIENALLALPQVIDAAAVGMPDARVGELPVAFVQLAPGAADPETLRELCAAKLDERAAVPVQLFAVEAIPRTAMNKTFKPELRRMAAAAAVQRIIADLPVGTVSGWSVRLDDGGGLGVEIELSAMDQSNVVVERIGALGLSCAIGPCEGA
ncbi:AMP-binding protein [Azospirillum sp. CT11-132]|uniref:AMP-binding protein n=1 Tax=Azospirillum sp. CT11-132 TaxID=3396317 RepID=UPI0039A415C1